MPRSASDFMDIYSAADSYDTWSRSHDDDETDSRTSEYSSRDHYRRGGGRRRLRTMDYLEEENSIIDSQGESSVSEIDGTRRRRRRRQHRDETNSYATDEVNEDEYEAAKRAEYSTVRKSSSNPFDDSTTEATLDAGDSLNENRTTTTSGQNEHSEAKKQAEYLAARRSMYNPFEDTESEASSLPSDERIGINRPRSQRMRPRRQPQEQLYSAGSLLDEDNPLSPVEEDSAVSSHASFDISPLPSDEHAGNEGARQTRGHLSRTFSDGRQPSPTFGSRRIDGLQKESALCPHPRAAERVEHYPDPSYSLSLSSSSPKKANSSDPSTGEETVSSTGDENQSHYNENVALHDLCSEATSPDDVAWRNALYLLSIEPELATRKEDGWSPLHVCCLGSAPPPDFMVRAILYCEPACARAIDEGGRLPLHMIAASSADTSIMQLLVEEYPSAVYKTDARGLTPLHMLMRNDDVELTMDRIRVLLGQTVCREKVPARNARIVQRRGQHLELNIDEINDRMVNRPPPGDGELDISFESQEGDQRHEIQIKNYPDDVQAAFQKLAMWKRKQKRLNQDPNDSPINIDLAQSHKDEEKNPAAIVAPPSMQLPLHMAVRRRDLDDDESFRDEEGDDYFDIKNPLPPNRNEILRVIIAAYPRGLVTRDANGNTPLMIVLLNQDCLPDIELIQLLLGMTTSGFQSPPPWADDLPLHKCPQGKYANPAMVPTTDTNQLPLHVAAEEMPSFYSAIESIHSAYPGAVVVQDVRGRTPLHMALRNYQRIQPDPKVVSLLLTDKVAQIRDDDGFLPFDLLVGGAHNLPKEEPMPSLWEDSTFDPSSVYKRFFIYVVMQAPRPRNRIEARAFLGRLRMLPPWLRRQACTVGFIQDMLIYEIASPEKCAFIILNGIVLALLLLMFRLQMDEYTSTGSAQVYYLPFVYLLGSLILLGQFINFCIATSHSVFWSQCMLNIWPWIDIVSVSVAMAATSLIQGESADVAGIASVGTAATGLLWASMIGYIARWWYGMAVFMGRTLRMFHLLVWPLIAALVLIVSFAEMFYSYNVTTSQEECDTSFGNRSLCTMREAFITVYLMLLGTPLIDTEDDSQNSLSSGSVVLISVFTTLLVLFIVSLLITVVSESMRMDLDDVALGYFWEPKLNFVFTVDDILSLFSWPKEQSFEKCGGTRKKRFVPKRSCGDRLSSFLGDSWTVMDYAIFGGERRRGNMWYVAYCDNASPFGVWPLRIICLIIIPVWLVIGLATFGLLWPPQIRRWLFRPSRSSIRNSREANAAAEYSGTQVAGMRGDVLQLKTMSYERSNDIKREILELKRLLYDAMEE